MKKYRLLCLCMAIALAALTSCSALNTETEELIDAPSPTGEYAGISKAFSKLVSGDYSLVYPATGDHTSAYVMHDINGDGQNEALVFYTLRRESHLLHISIMEKERNKWRIAADYSTGGTGVYKLIFSDLTGSGSLSIVIGVTDSTDKSSRLEVLSFNGSSVTNHMQGSYLEFAAADMDRDGRDELVVLRDQYNDNVAVQRMAVMCRFDPSGNLIKDEIYSAAIDKKATSYSTPLSGKIEYSSGKDIYYTDALYFDAVKSEGLITEIVYFDSLTRTLVTPAYDPEIEANTSTVRSTGKRAGDINGDGIIEVPYDTALPGPEYTETVYATKWMSLYKDNSLIDVLTAYIDRNYGFMLSFPEQWAESDSITVLRSNNLLVFALWDTETKIVGKNLLEIRIFDQGKWTESGASGEKYIRLGTRHGRVYVSRILETDNKYSITEEQVINGFSFR